MKNFLTDLVNIWKMNLKFIVDYWLFYLILSIIAIGILWLVFNKIKNW